MFEKDPGAEFEFFLAQKLGLTARRLRAEMSQQEFMEWGVFYARKAQREELEMAKTRGR